MPTQTTNYHLEKLQAGEPFSSDGQKYTTSDRDQIDRILKLGAETHHHTGLSAASNNPTVAPNPSLSLTGGTLPAGNTAYYKYTWVDPTGLETAPSPVASMALPAQCVTPGAPTLSFSSSTGTLTAGPYLYLLTAYTGTSTEETVGSTAGSITTTGTGEIIVTFPTLPSGATGFNIYRFAPGGNSYMYMVTVPISGGSPTSWTDNGSVAANCNRFPPGSNTTNSTSSVTVSLPVAIPATFTWNLYRTFDNTNWTNSLLASITTTATTYTDIGAATLTGQYPAASQLVGTPTKILLTGGAEVQGLLPSSMIAGGGGGGGGSTDFAVEFSYPGNLAITTGVATWVCPFSTATIVSVTCTLGRGSIPASTAVIADVFKGSGVNPSYGSIYSGASPNFKPQIPVGQQIGIPAPPNVTSLVAGDSLTSSILQVGGGATPTDHDLTIVVSLQVSG